MAIRNIILDLGGVLLNLDIPRTFTAFEQLGVTDFQQYYQQSYSNPLFARLEKGACTPEEFYEDFRATTGLKATDQAIADAWNAMLLDFRTESMAYLQTLRNQYRVFLLSNTNEIHLRAFRQIHYEQFGHHGFDDLFEKAWYSHELGLRKPDVPCYTEVLARHQLSGAETLFVDDTPVNIEGAKKAGLVTGFLPKGATIEELVPGWLA
ncbi:MAG TPA: HAD family phosphatase [Phnomibacter sp.]|nr:HAD family phosphatase [Phnomibacter sp.]